MKINKLKLRKIIKDIVVEENKKIILENKIRKYVRKEILNENENNSNLKTVGDLKKTLVKMGVLNIGRKIVSTVKDEVIDAASQILGDLIPGVGAIKGAFKLFKLVSKTPDTKANNHSVLKAFDIDDGVARLIDDKIEEKFFEYMAEKFNDFKDETLLSDLPPMTEILANFIKQYDETKGVEISSWSK